MRKVALAAKMSFFLNLFLFYFIECLLYFKGYTFFYGFSFS